MGHGVQEQQTKQLAAKQQRPELCYAGAGAPDTLHAPQKCCTTKMLQTLAVILHDLSTLQLPVKPVTVHMDKPQY